MIPDLYPPAIRKLDGTGTGSWSGRGAWKIVLHTTETRGIPGYSGGALAPHLTFWPARGSITQHTPFSRPAEAVLAHDDDQILQVEIVCYSSQSTATSVGGLWVGALTDAQLEPIAVFAAWVREFLPVAARWPERQAFNASQANAPGFRYTLSQFRAFDGILGHQHIPDNTHWDPGAFPWERFLNLIGDDMTPEEVAAAVWGFPAKSGNIDMGLQVDRNYRNINELIIAHRTSTLGTTAMAEISDDDLQDIAVAVNDELARRQQA